jgi:hypothetical protein
VPCAVIGTVGGARLKMALRGRVLVDEGLPALTELWRGAFVHAIESADVL